MSAFKNVSVMALSMFVEKIFGFAALVVYAHLLDVKELAIIPFASLAAGLALVSLLGGIQPLLMKDLPRLIKQKNICSIEQMISNSWWISLVSVIIFFIFWMLFGRNFYIHLGFPPIGPMGEIFLGAYIAIQIHHNIQARILVCGGKYKFIALAGVCRSILQPVVIIGAYLLYGVAGLTIGLFCVCASLVLGYEVILHGMGRKYFYPQGSINLIKKSLVFYVEGFVNYFRMQGDSFITTLILGAETLGVYFIGKRFIELSQLISRSLDNVMTPALSRLAIKSTAEFGQELQHALALTMLAGFSMVIFNLSFLPVYLRFITDEDLSFLWLPMTFLSFKILLDLVKSGIIGRSIFVLFPPRYRLMLSSTEAIVLLLSLYFGATYFGLLGVAMSPLIAGVFSAVYGRHVLRKKISVVFFDKFFFRASIVCVVLLIFVVGYKGFFFEHIFSNKYYEVVFFLSLSVGICALACAMLLLFRNNRVDMAISKYCPQSITRYVLRIPKI